jgi:hypothetical protein
VLITWCAATFHYITESLHSKTKLRQEINLESPETDTSSRNRKRTYFSSSDTGINRYIAGNKKERYCDTFPEI